MKSSILKALIIMLIVVLVGLFISTNKRIKNLRKQVSIEAAKTNFLLKQLDANNVYFDSVYTKNDTVSFYKNGSLMGRSVIVIE